MLNDEILLYRLSLIKYIFENSKSESKKPEPLCITSLLMLHDSIELFLQLIIEHYDITCGQLNFLDYWDTINSANKSITITQKESMKRLNKARVSFKHVGTMPSRFDLDSFLSITSSFYEENCENIFHVSFENISMLELVTNTELKELLSSAQEELKTSNNQSAIEKCTIAFYRMIRIYESNKIPKYNRSIFNITEDTSFLTSFYMDLDRSSFTTEGKLGQFVDKTNRSIEQLQETVKMIGYGIDFRKYALFKHITPSFYSTLDGKAHFRHQKEYPKENIQYCIDFCIECFLKLMSFDFSITKTTS